MALLWDMALGGVDEYYNGTTPAMVRVRVSSIMAAVVAL